MMRTLVFVSVVSLLMLAVPLFQAACYDATKLPPCSQRGATWPDPCAASPRDAGKDR